MKTKPHTEDTAREMRCVSFAIEERVLENLPRVAQAVRARHQTELCNSPLPTGARAAESGRMAEEWAVLLGPFETALTKFVDDNEIKLLRYERPPEPR